MTAQADVDEATPSLWGDTAPDSPGADVAHAPAPPPGQLAAARRLLRSLELQGWQLRAHPLTGEWRVLAREQGSPRALIPKTAPDGEAHG
jgi:hypothetical protein